MRNTLSKLIVGSVVLLALCSFLSVVAVGQLGDGRVDTYSDGFRIGSDGGTIIDMLAAKQISFTGGTSGTTTITGVLPGDTYLYMDGWSSSSADHGKVTYAVTTNTITATIATATTGTLNVFIVGLK
jgi:hypothetical protein